MPESKPDTPRFSADAIGKSDLAKIDAHEITPEEYEELPEITDEMVARAKFYVGGKPVPHPLRGRPRLAAPKRQVTLRLDADVIERFRASGPGWQSRVNEILRKALG